MLSYFLSEDIALLKVAENSWRRSEILGSSYSGSGVYLFSLAISSGREGRWIELDQFE
jgi:hypothetical protein